MSSFLAVMLVVLHIVVAVTGCMSAFAWVEPESFFGFLMFIGVWGFFEWIGVMLVHAAVAGIAALSGEDIS